MVRFAVAAHALLLATINASEVAIDGHGLFFANRYATFDGGRELFSKVCVLFIYHFNTMDISLTISYFKQKPVYAIDSRTRLDRKVPISPGYGSIISSTGLC